MPYTRKQVKLFFSSGSPLTEEQQEKVHKELHENPALGHAKKGSAAMKRGKADTAAKPKAKRKPKPQASGLNWRDHWGRNKVKK